MLATLFIPGDTLLLQGELGAGKTTLVQAIAHGLGVGEDQYVSSPSFGLLHEYFGSLPIYHMDLYRLEDEDEVEAAGLNEYLEGEGVCCIEWPDRLGMFTPKEFLEVELLYSGADTRSLEFKAHGKTWLERLSELRGVIDSFSD